MVEHTGNAAAVTIPLIQKAFDDLFASPTLQALKHTSFHQRLFLASIMREVRVSGQSQVEYSAVI